MQTKRRALIVSSAVALAVLCGVVLGDASTICTASGGCHVCQFFASNGDYQGYVSWGCN